ncbi:MAG: hypothetical protein K2X74_09865 [Acetobacteraceae bacterium]|nr:hypothetical protein [Acetobacteraceae bacterium]
MWGSRIALALAVALCATQARSSSRSYICFFDRESVELTNRCQQIALAFLEFWRSGSRTGWRIAVLGHADGAEPEAASLGARRARAVAAFLALNGVAAEAMREIDVGKRRPLAPSPPTKPEPQNRRVELLAIEPPDPRPPLRDLFDDNSGFIPRSR